MSKKDKDLFRDAVQGVKPLKHDKVVLKQEKPKREPPKREPDPDSLPPIVSSDENLFYKTKPLPAKLQSQLKRGKLKPEETIDLHGMIEADAKAYLDSFLDECIAHGSFCVCVIHGKGRKKPENPILKNMTNRFLRDDSRVLAFCSEPGNVGAVLVLLT